MSAGDMTAPIRARFPDGLRKDFPRGVDKVQTISLAALVVVASLAVAWASPAAGGQAYAEAQAQVVTEGLTVGELLQQQADLSRWLASELPSAALLAPSRIGL